jgi:alpha-galactosidase/6-phospho-beta-glucosidase family protein
MAPTWESEAERDRAVPPHITIVGGGSTHWTPTLLVDFANTPSLADAELTLHDINGDSLPQMLELIEHVTQSRGIGLTARATTDLPAALEGAEFVLTTLSVGGFSSMQHDIEIPYRYGIRQPVGDSVGPGGIMRALRSIPVMVEIARATEAHAPDALLLNVSNPLTTLCRAVTRETAVTTVGLCNELVGFQFAMSLLFDCGMHEINPVVAGVNHLPLITGLTIGADDGFAMLRDLLERPGSRGDEPIWMTPPPASHWKKRSSGEEWTKSDVVHNNMVKFDLFQRFGVMPGSSDTHVVEFFPGFVTAASDFGRQWGVHHYGVAGHTADKADDDASVDYLMKMDEIPPWPSGELVADLLDSVVTGKERWLPMNLPNTGQVANLPEGAFTECIGIANADGVHPRDTVTVPSVMGEYLRRINVSQELTVEAALTGNRTTVLEAMLADQMVGRLPYEHVVAMTGELLAATAPWLPQFSPAA